MQKEKLSGRKDEKVSNDEKNQKREIYLQRNILFKKSEPLIDAILKLKLLIDVTLKIPSFWPTKYN